jgi:hypothetical protein
MDGFKDSTKTKYMCGGPVKKARGGMMDEGVSTRPTDKYGRRITLAEMDIGPVKEAPKKAMAKGIGAMSAALAASKKMTDAMQKPVKKAMGGSVSDKPMQTISPSSYGTGKPKPAPTKGPMGPKPAPTMGKGPRRPQPPIMDKGPMGPKPAPTMGEGPGQPTPPPTKGAPDMYEPQISGGPVPYSKGGSAKKGVPAYSGKPMIGRKAGGLSVMPKGKC